MKLFYAADTVFSMLSNEKPNESERLQAVRAAYIQPSQIQQQQQSEYTTTNDSALAAVSLILIKIFYISESCLVMCWQLGSWFFIKVG